LRDFEVEEVPLATYKPTTKTIPINAKTTTKTTSTTTQPPPNLAKMSREQSGTGQTDFGTTGASNTGFQASTAGFEDTQRPVHYLCGDCDNKVTLKRGDPIRCKECGYRVLYKERTNR
jgi:DNA-directed RNA polymerase I, II, and III subunit RPABC4